MKTTIEVSGYEIKIEEMEGKIMVSAMKDDEVVEEFELESEGMEGEEGFEDEMEGGEDEMSAFGEEEDEMGDFEEGDEDDDEGFDDDDDEMEEDEEEKEETGKLESFSWFVKKRKK
jgi:hypothetical protein